MQHKSNSALIDRYESYSNPFNGGCMSHEDKIAYHATQAWLHLSELKNCQLDTLLGQSSLKTIDEAIVVTDYLSGGEDARKDGGQTNF